MEVDLQLRSDVTTPREVARAIPKPVALLSVNDSIIMRKRMNGPTYTSPKLIKAQTEIFVFNGRLVFHITKTGSSEHIKSVRIENAARFR